jgi:fibronectin type 3 domain-containing protein
MVSILVLVLIGILTSFAGVVAAVPSAPINLTAVVMAGGQVNLSWNDNSSDETGFLIDRSIGNIDDAFVSFKVSFKVPADTNNFIDNTVEAGTAYYYRVSAIGEQENSTFSNTVTATTPDTLTFPKPPLGLTAKAEIAPRVSLNWKDQSDNEEGFRIERTADSLFTKELKTFQVKAGEVSLVDSTVEGRKTYYYRVIAWNTDGDSSPSNAVSVTTLAAIPEAPTNLVVQFAGDRQIILRWIDNSETENGFQLERATDSGFQHDLAIFTGAASAGSRVPVMVTDHQTPAGLFLYRVKAYNDSGNSEYSNVANITINDFPNQDTPLFGNDTAFLSYPGFTLLSPISVRINAQAQAQEGSIILSSLDNKARLEIPAGIKMFNVNGHPLTEINYFVPDIFPQIPNDKSIIDAFNFGPNGATFSNKATLTLKYNPADFPLDVTYNDLEVICWNGSDWKSMDDLKFKPEENTLSVSVLHTGLMAIISPKPDLSAKFAISNLYIFPQSAKAGNTVYISLTVTNIGHSFGYYDVVLNLNGAVEDKKLVSLEAGENTDVQFTCANKPVADYKFDVNNAARGSFSISEASVNSPSPTLAPTPSVIPTYSPVEVPEKPAQFPIFVVVLASALALVIVLIIVFILLRR